MTRQRCYTMIIPNLSETLGCSIYEMTATKAALTMSTRKNKAPREELFETMLDTYLCVINW